MQDEQNVSISEDERRLIQDVTETLDEIVGTLRQGNAVPRPLIERGEQVWAALDERSIQDSGTRETLLLEGEGNLERAILYRLEHDEPIDAETLDAANKWIDEARRLASSSGQSTGESSGQTH